jgi:hypothetical protein
VRFRGPELAAAGSPLAALLPVGAVPWYAHAMVALSGPIVYALRLILMYRLGSKVLNQSVDVSPELLAVILDRPEPRSESCKQSRPRSPDR